MIEVKTSVFFEKDAKKLLKKFRSLEKEIQDLIIALRQNPRLGDEVIENVYKIRLAIKSKNSGKRGGARVITYVEAIFETEIIESINDNQTEATTIVHLLSIYDKSEQSSISEEYIKELLKLL